jgi:hypothetical protein
LPDSSLPGFSFNFLVFNECPDVLKGKGEAKNPEVKPIA